MGSTYIDEASTELGSANPSHLLLQLCIQLLNSIDEQRRIKKSTLCYLFKYHFHLPIPYYNDNLINTGSDFVPRYLQK